MELSIITIAPITAALIEVLKRTKGINAFLDGKWELVALAIAVVIAVLGGIGPLNGIIAGLTSMGLYDGVTKGVSMVKESQQ